MPMQARRNKMTNRKTRNKRNKRKAIPIRNRVRIRS